MGFNKNHIFTSIQLKIDCECIQKKLVNIIHLKRRMVWIFRPGIAYEFIEGDSGEGVPVGLLKAKSALVFNTSNTESSREKNVFKDPLETIWKNCIFDLCGVHDFYRRMFNIVVTSSEEQRIDWLSEVSEIVNRYYPNGKMAEPEH